ncbi:MFS transporter [Amycolatopsis sp. FDAARGOS 1241]|uniref:MFS transporter n=1 Tax=Amycolatopsis sp. FDAARGOS 1241 TaxID=2778070 RepID=UPI00195279FA|nr:MFS transporter [Amycolatopsis sp. FDAARGOS 1241]QRP47404.1 MFS transporter [Amycolatopsis sp. FDAARGOS 1241]
MPLAAQVWLLDAVPETPEAASAANVTNLQLSLAAGSALGGVLVDSTTLPVVFLTAGATVFAAGVIAAVAGRRGRPATALTGRAVVVCRESGAHGLQRARP